MCNVAAKYDPTRVRPGYTFASLAWDIAEKRIIDWWRHELGDARYPERAREKAVFRNTLSWNRLTEERESPELEPKIEDEYFAGGFEGAAAAMGATVSEDGRWTLENLARPIAEGAKTSQAAFEAGITTHRAKRQLEELRDEIERRRVAQNGDDPETTPRPHQHSI